MYLINMKNLLLITFLVCVIQVSAQGPWAPGKGHGYTQLLFNLIPPYSQVYDGGSTTREVERELFDFTVAAYGEFGINDQLTVGANIPFILVNTGANTDPMTAPNLPSSNLASLGNVSVFGKYTLLDQSVKVAFIGQVDLPTSDRDSESGLSTGVDATTLQPKLSVGGGQNSWFAYGFFGYGYRTNDHHDFLNFGVEGGLKASEDFTVILNINRWHNLDNGDPGVDAPNIIETGFYTSFQEYNAFLLKIFAENLIGNGFGGFASVGGGSGTSVAASPALSLGLFYKW
jgi:hypothetical protein